jgi:hypothetical protein
MVPRIADNGAMRWLTLASAAALGGLIFACGGSENKETLAPRDPAQLLTNAAKAVGGAGSFHFKLTHENGSTPLPLNLRLDSAEGDIGVPDRLAADVRAKAGGVSVSVKVIGIGDETWITNPFTRGWQKLPGATIRDFADPAALVIELLPQVKDARLAGEAKVEGVQTYHVEGSIDSGALRPALGFARAGLTVKAEIWVGKEDGLPYRVRLTGRLVADEDEGVVRLVELSRFGADVDIQPPD